MIQPPQQVGGMPVVLYAPIDDRHVWKRTCQHYVQNEEVGPFQALTITKDSHGFYLLYCDSEWNVLADIYHGSLDDAKGQAEFEFEGVNETWAEPT